MGARKTWRYTEAGKPLPRPILVTGTDEPRHMVKDGTFEDRMVATLYDMECEQGSRFNGVGTIRNGRPEYNSAFLKKVWIDQRDTRDRDDARREQAKQRAIEECSGYQ